MGRESTVADDVSKQSGPFDVSTIETLVGLMSKHDISEIDLREGNQRILLRRGMTVPTMALPAPVVAPALVAATVASPTNSQASLEKPPTQNLKEIKSPAIGTFYAREKPEAPPYVTIGSRVTPTSTVGLLEAMKVFSEVPAGCSGLIVEVLVEQGEAVEYNQVLFRVDESR